MKYAKLCKVQDYTRCKVVPGHKPMFCNSLSAEGAKAVLIKAWALKAGMLMPNSGRFVRLCVVRLCVRLTILNLFKVYMNLSLRFFHFKFFKVLKQIMYLWFKWIMERCYPHLRWYFFTFVHQVLYSKCLHSLGDLILSLWFQFYLELKVKFVLKLCCGSKNLENHPKFCMLSKDSHRKLSKLILH